MKPLVLAVLASVAAQGDPLERVEGKSIEARQALIVGTTGPRAIRAGMDVLERGGSAVDAALTTALLQTTLCAGCWVSFAGRMTAVVFDAETGEVHALNACYDAPRDEDDPLSIPRQPTPSGRTVLVPGFMAGVGALHERFGRLGFAELFAPSIALAEEGFALTPNLERLIGGKREVLLRTEGGRRVFLNAEEELHRAGETFRQLDLAHTLRRTAEEGAGHFYTGEWAKRFVAAVQAEGGRLSLEDLAAYRPRWERPASATFRGTTVYGLPTPNRGGPSTVLALGLAERAGLYGDNHFSTSAEALRRLAAIEQGIALTWSQRGRRALTEVFPATAGLWRNHHGDREANDALWEALMSPRWVEVLGVARGEASRDDHSDAVVAVDRDGNVVALIHTINTAGWGTTGLFVGGVSIPDSGASQQGAMAAVGPGGRMPDHGVPLIGLRDGRPVLASSACGSGNVQASWQNAIQILGYGRTPAEVADGPHLYGGRVRSADYPAEHVRRVRELGFDLGTVERFGNFEKGYWVGATLDPETGLLRAACLRQVDGIAVGR